MLVQLRRLTQDTHATIGDVLVDMKPVCKSLEDPWHVAKINGSTRIPAGLYPMALRAVSGLPERETLHDKYLKRFPEFHKGMLWIREVPWFEYVYVHIGNDPDDTKGCVLVGTDVEGHTLTGSEKAYRELYPMIAAAFAKGENVWFQVVDP